MSDRILQEAFDVIEGISLETIDERIKWLETTLHIYKTLKAVKVAAERTPRNWDIKAPVKAQEQPAPSRVVTTKAAMAREALEQRLRRSPEGLTIKQLHEAIPSIDRQTLYNELVTHLGDLYVRTEIPGPRGPMHAYRLRGLGNGQPV